VVNVNDFSKTLRWSLDNELNVGQHIPNQWNKFIVSAPKRFINTMQCFRSGIFFRICLRPTKKTDPYPGSRRVKEKELFPNFNIIPIKNRDDPDGYQKSQISGRIFKDLIRD